MKRKITIHRWLAGASLLLAYGLVERLDVTGEAVTLSQTCCCSAASCRWAECTGWAG